MTVVARSDFGAGCLFAMNPSDQQRTIRHVIDRLAFADGAQNSAAPVLLIDVDMSLSV
jgi:hypothetical protein